MFKYVKEFLLFGFLPLLLDRVTKYMIVHHVLNDGLIMPCLQIYGTYNYGVAWGIGSCWDGIGYLLLLLLIPLNLVYFIWISWRLALSRFAFCATLLIIFGGFSNLIDRIWYGGVIDWISIYYQNYFFPIFNVADISITLGSIWLAWLMMTDRY